MTTIALVGSVMSVVVILYANVVVLPGRKITDSGAKPENETTEVGSINYWGLMHR